MGVERLLLDYGALGVFAVLSIGALLGMWRALRHEQAQHMATVQRFAEELDKLQSKHQAQLEQLTERMLNTYQTTSDKYHALAAAQGQLLEALGRKVEKRA